MQKALRLEHIHLGCLRSDLQGDQCGCSRGSQGVRSERSGGPGHRGTAGPPRGRALGPVLSMRDPISLNILKKLPVAALLKMGFRGQGGALCGGGAGSEQAMPVILTPGRAWVVGSRGRILDVCSCGLEYRIEQFS